MGHFGLLALLIASAVHCGQSQQNPLDDLQVDQAGQSPWLDEAAVAAWGQGRVLQGSSGVEPIPDYGAGGSLLAVDQPAIPIYQQL